VINKDKNTGMYQSMSDSPIETGEDTTVAGFSASSQSKIGLRRALMKSARVGERSDSIEPIPEEDENKAEKEKEEIPVSGLFINRFLPPRVREPYKLKASHSQMKYDSVFAVTHVFSKEFNFSKERNVSEADSGSGERAI
jgi:hypothetical protein